MPLKVSHFNVRKKTNNIGVNVLCQVFASITLKRMERKTMHLTDYMVQRHISTSIKLQFRERKQVFELVLVILSNAFTSIALQCKEKKR